jgi:hypothetical protein
VEEEADGNGDALWRARIVVLALAAAVVLYGVVGLLFTAARSDDAPLADDSATLWVMRGALAVVTVINFSTGAYLRRGLLGSGATPPGGTGRPLVPATVVSGALAEAVGIYGLVLTLLGGEPWDVMVFGVVALLALAAVFPRREAWEVEALRP